MMTNSHAVAATVASITIKVTKRWRSATTKARSYPASSASKHHSRARDNRPRSAGCSCRNSRAPIIGVKVSETSAETAMATVTVTANS
jgi:hypothetical protein